MEPLLTPHRSYSWPLIIHERCIRILIGPTAIFYYHQLTTRSVDLERLTLYQRMEHAAYSVGLLP